MTEWWLESENDPRVASLPLCSQGREASDAAASDEICNEAAEHEQKLVAAEYSANDVCCKFGNKTSTVPAGLAPQAESNWVLS